MDRMAAYLVLWLQRPRTVQQILGSCLEAAHLVAAALAQLPVTVPVGAALVLVQARHDAVAQLAARLCHALLVDLDEVRHARRVCMHGVERFNGLHACAHIHCKIHRPPSAPCRW